jgi:tetratricopeptide (TPR) repeat protein
LAGVVVYSLLPSGGSDLGQNPASLIAEGSEIARRSGEGGGVEAALPYFEKATSLAPEDPVANAALGRAFLELNRFTEALPHLQKARERAPDNHEVALHVGMCLTGLERHDEAREHLEGAIRLQPNNPRPLYFLGVGAMRLGSAKDTIRYLSPFVRDVPGNVVAMRILADALDSVGRKDEATDVLRKLTQVTPRDMPARRALQDRRLRAEGLAPVLADAAKRAEAEGALPEDLYLHGRLLALSPDHQDEARAAFKKLKQAYPEVEQAELELAALDAREGKLDTARKRLEAVLAANPGNEEVRARLADVELQAGAFAEAQARYEGLLGGRLQAHAHLGIVSALLDSGKGEEALAFVEPLLEGAEASDPRRWALRGDTLKTLGQFDACDEVLDELLEKGRPSDRLIWLGYKAFLALERGDDAAAQAAFDVLVEAAGDVELPPDITLWRAIVSDPAEEPSLLEAAAEGPDHDVMATHSRAAKRILGRATREQLLAAAAIADYRHANDALYFEGVALERSGDKAGAKAAYAECIDASRANDFPVRRARRALERLSK